MHSVGPQLEETDYEHDCTRVPDSSNAGHSSDSHADTRQLFNSHDLTGWKHVGDGRFVIEDGLLHPEGGVGLLWFEGEKVGDAVVRVVYMVRAREDNSGVFVRIPEPPKDQWMPVDKALEVQINDAEESDYYRTGSRSTPLPKPCRARAG
jgi:hypothetical protein